MAKPKNIEKFQQVHKVHSRPGEGSVIGSVIQRIANPDGTIGISLSVDLNTAQVPDRRYVATVASIAVEGDLLTLIFGQKKLGASGGCRSLVLVQMFTPSVHPFLQSSERMLDSIRQYVERYDASRARLSDIVEDVPGQTVALACNVVAAGFTGRDSCMDFYYSSSFAMAIAGRGGDFVAEPVVRVQLPTTLLLAILERLEALKEMLPRDQEVKEET